MNYLKQVAQVFGAAWNGRKYSIRSAPALRAFVRVAPDVIRRLDQERADRTDFRAIGRVIAPWGRRIGDLRFETEGAWKRNGSSVEQLAKELRLALQYPEGAGSSRSHRTRRVDFACKFDTNCKFANSPADTNGEDLAISQGRERGTVLAPI